VPESSFYVPLGADRFASTPAVVGPWDPRLAHGSPPAALLLRAIDAAHPRDDVRVARFTLEFFGPVPASEVTVATEVVRPGARIELLRARLSAQGKVALEANVWRIAVAAGRVPEVPDVRPVPALPGPQELQRFVDVPAFGYGEAIEWRYAEGAFDALGPATVYSRPRIPLVEGEPTSPLGRLLLMVDSANGLSAELQPSRFTFVPVELTVSVRRHPRTEWVGMSARTTIDADGIGQARADLFDQDGHIGAAMQTLFVAPR
jgi:hypothetical protein